MGSKFALARQGRLHRVDRASGEDGKKRVAAITYDFAAGRLEARSQETSMDAQQPSEGVVADRAEETGRPLNIRENQRGRVALAAILRVPVHHGSSALILLM
jgi:hypothetical protein